MIAGTSLVKVDWSRHFKLNYIKHILSIQTNSKGYGEILVGHYLPKDALTKESAYRNGDLYIVSEFLNNQWVKKEEGYKEHCLYHLVRVNKDSELGYNIISTIEDRINYSHHESKLIEEILKDPELVKSIGVLKK